MLNQVIKKPAHVSRFCILMNDARHARDSQTPTPALAGRQPHASPRIMLVRAQAGIATRMSEAVCRGVWCTCHGPCAGGRGTYVSGGCRVIVAHMLVVNAGL